MTENTETNAAHSAPLLEARKLSCERDERLLFADLSLIVGFGSVL